MSKVTTNFSPEEIRHQIVARSILLTVGNKGLAIIKARTLEGVFLPGSTPGSEKYSTKPAPMPLGGLFKRLGVTRAKSVWERIQKGTEDADIFATSRGAIWILLKGGYKRLRELGGRESALVNLNWTGSMMRALKIINVDIASNSVTLGFTDKRAEQIASFHKQGAGRSKVKRLFVGLTDKEINTVGKEYKMQGAI